MSPETLASVYAAVGRWFWYVSIVVIGGAAGFRMAVRGQLRSESGARPDPVEHGLLRFSLAAAIVLSAAVMWRLYAQTYSIFGVDESVTWEYIRIVVLDTAWGTGWRWQMTTAILAVALLVASFYVPRARTALTVAAVLALVVTVPLTGHAVSREGKVWLSVIAQIAHMAGASLWVGTLLAVMLFVRPGNDGAFGAAVRAFSPLAVGAVSVLVGSGMLTAIVYLDSISDLWTGVYGRTLVLKLLLFGVVAGLGAYNWRRLKPTLDQPKTAALLTRSARTELIIAGVTLAVTAVLVALPLTHE